MMMDDFMFEFFFLVYHAGDEEMKNNVVVIIGNTFTFIHVLCNTLDVGKPSVVYLFDQKYFASFVVTFLYVFLNFIYFFLNVN